ncbi:PQQ-binding-like beta-propeller repeat protein [Flagellimonas myxillae]|uniref:outer membrane protein assembly factor BamB family protein n=1 Tax=Flagellimonas myxillae TaxID=2942214 RepID=UPI00201F002F|nr:PQQ-binding-like beta-propeller repeat protein [Muricauda myxillae]MCL6265477.1 PQQ-binding-like beta-propeller repeat protein [Muricauda myxillae]
MLKNLTLALSLLVGLAAQAQTGNNWPQPSGPIGDWTIKTDDKVPVEFSVTTGKNILWKAELPEGGQSGITIWEDAIFLTVMKPVQKIEEGQPIKGADVLALHIDAKDGRILWQKELKGSADSEYMYGFSDSSTPGPVTDGKHVWFYNASGNLSCFDFDGNRVWERTWNPVEELDGVHFPFNKQFEPVVVGALIINMETYWEKDGDRVYGWNYLYGIDKATGKVRWISQDGLTHYNTPFLSTTSDGKPAMMIGRGGHHDVPETPVGYSLIDLENGKRIWKYDADEGLALYNATWNEDYAVWYTEKECVVHLVDSKTGKLQRKVSLTANADIRSYDTETDSYMVQKNVDIQKDMGINVFPAWFTNIVVEDKLFFLCFKSGNYRKDIGPEYSIARVDLNTGKAEYLQLPVQVAYAGNDKSYIWNKEMSTQTINARGLDVSNDKRSRRDGWHWNFNGNPIAVNGKIFFTTMLGVVYCIDATTDVFDETAFISLNDLGPQGNTWSVNTPSFAQGRLYHRTLKHLICIAEK